MIVASRLEVEFLLNILLEDHGKLHGLFLLVDLLSEERATGSDGYGVLRGVGFSLIIK